MHISKLHFDGQTFILTADQDIDALKASIVVALRPGSGFVEFESIGRGLISLLITPAIPVRFEIIERTEDEISGWEAHPPAIEDSRNFDFDYFAGDLTL